MYQSNDYPTVGSSVGKVLSEFSRGLIFTQLCENARNLICSFGLLIPNEPCNKNDENWLARKLIRAKIYTFKVSKVD